MLTPTFKEVDRTIKKILLLKKVPEDVRKGFRSAVPFLRDEWPKKEGAVQLSLACGFAAVMTKHGFKATKEEKPQYMLVAWWTDAHGVRHCSIEPPQSYRYQIRHSCGFWGLVYPGRARRLIDLENERITGTLSKKLGDKLKQSVYHPISFFRYRWLLKPEAGMAVLIRDESVSKSKIQCKIIVQDVPGSLWVGDFTIKRRIPATMIREATESARTTFNRGCFQAQLPYAYMRLNGISPDSPEGQQILGHAVLTQI